MAGSNKERKRRNHTRTWNYEIVKLLEQRDKNWRAKEKRVEEFLLPCLDEEGLCTTFKSKSSKHALAQAYVKCLTSEQIIF
jgi:hypothetical protein